MLKTYSSCNENLFRSVLMVAITNLRQIKYSSMILSPHIWIMNSCISIDCTAGLSLGTNFYSNSKKQAFTSLMKPIIDTLRKKIHLVRDRWIHGHLKIYLLSHLKDLLWARADVIRFSLFPLNLRQIKHLQCHLCPYYKWRTSMHSVQCIISYHCWYSQRNTDV